MINVQCSTYRNGTTSRLTQTPSCGCGYSYFFLRLAAGSFLRLFLLLMNHDRAATRFTNLSCFFNFSKVNAWYVTPPCTCNFKYGHMQGRFEIDITAMPFDVVFMLGNFQTKCKHSVSDSSERLGPRVNFSFRELKYHNKNCNLRE